MASKDAIEWQVLLIQWLAATSGPEPTNASKEPRRYLRSGPRSAAT